MAIISQTKCDQCGKLFDAMGIYMVSKERRGLDFCDEDCLRAFLDKKPNTETASRLTKAERGFLDKFLRKNPEIVR